MVAMVKTARSWMCMCNNRVDGEVGGCERSMGQGKGYVPFQGSQSHGVTDLVEEVKATSVMPWHFSPLGLAVKGR